MSFIPNSIAHKFHVYANIYTMPATRRFLDRARSARPSKKTRYLVVKPESKYANRNITHLAVTNSTTVLTAIAAGSGSSGGRDGRKIKLKSFEMKLQVDTALASFYRIVFYVPKNATDTLALANVYSAIENDQIWVLHDRFLYFQSTGGTPVDNSNATQSYRHSFPMGLGVEFDGDATSDFVKNPVKMLILSSTTTSVLGHTKVWYTDV